MVACTPHPGLGTVSVAQVQLDLATCRRSTAPGHSPPSNGVTVVARLGSQTILYKGKVVLRVAETYKDAPAGNPGPILLEGISPDEKWILYAIDPLGSSSLAADGLTLRAVNIATRKTVVVGFGLQYTNYRAWCGNRLVMTAGGDRIAVHAKRLVVTGPPDWKPRRLVEDAAMSFGAVVCDGNSVIVQEQENSTDANFFHTHWRLVRVGLDGKVTPLTAPPPGYADESPQLTGGILYFVRSTRGHGRLYALQSGKVVGPLLSLGYSLGYYGHQDWPYRVTR